MAHKSGSDCQNDLVKSQKNRAPSAKLFGAQNS